ncbi:Phosphatidylglycerophosphate phosphatase 1, chloroplastic [Pleodorina starrii]|uniref:Phosphatidylglycerophosphate phosphatase 1, chloroplastic n=1 Tax=Pleodorina starrii TaxID=330485 RepID=A0A9W6BID4_9CHLO|nr:Phosphatidylglycerophosphate phosphatase 1 [Pleodorina starrii]GLC52644.1 Phosphatidylglycerophosphate phosphatase 1, chloroplastic [Pleodorina starrii]GLC71652.1 Phosphatidylglycerophosphate phosphatase 1 [Pleodorina starrii]
MHVGRCSPQAVQAPCPWARSRPRAATRIGGATHAHNGASQASEMARVQQNFNSAGVGLFFSLFGGSQSLALPHLAVPDIRHVDWEKLRAAGFRGLVFDKDNTLSQPFALEVEPRLRGALDRCLAAFEGRAVLYSNSAGLLQYDPEGAEARQLEAALGIPVLRHADKKPGGGSAELEAHFGCPASDLIMVGDRYLTDVAFGNRHGMLTVHVQPLTSRGEPLGVLLARRVEEFWVARWTAAGVHPPAHARAPYASLQGFIREPTTATAATTTPPTTATATTAAPPATAAAATKP